MVIGVSSLFFSPMAWPFLLVYTCLGVVAGFLMSLGDLAGFVGLLILIGAAGTATFLNEVEPQWHLAWWQPGIIALMGLAIEHLTPEVIRRFR